MNAEGYPVIIPVIQVQALDHQHLLFTFGAYGDELEEIPAYTTLAVFGMALTMEDVLVRGTHLGIRHIAGIRCGVIELVWAYNPMPPVPLQIYPSLPVETVKSSNPAWSTEL